MATVRDTTCSALVVVNMQIAVMSEAWNAERVTANVASAVDSARSAGVPVIWIRHSDDTLPYGSPGWELVDGLAPAPDEAVIDKRFASSFERTELEQQLENAAASHIVLAGAATNFCIRATAYAALDRGYDLTLVADAHTTGPMVLGDATINAPDIIDELNAVLSWIAYPGRVNRSLPVSEIDFLGLGARSEPGGQHEP